MNTLFNVVVCFVLILVQTSLMPLSRMFSQFFDLLLPFVVYMGLTGSFRAGLPVLLVAGYAMDVYTGGPFGVYMTTYIWICLGVRWLTRYLHARSELLWMCVIPAGVLLENLVTVGVVGLLGWEMIPYRKVLDAVAIQLFWASLLGPIMLLVLYYAGTEWRHRVADRFFKTAME